MEIPRNLGDEKYDHRIKHLEAEHQKLDDIIDKLERADNYNDVELHQLKKKRLHVKDEIEQTKRKKEANESAEGYRSDRST